METRFRDAGSSTEMLDQFLDYFSSKLPDFNLCGEEVTLTQTSRTLYLDKLQQMETYCQNVSESSENSDEESCNETDIHEAPRQKSHNVKNKLRRIRDRFRKKMFKEIQVNRFLRKKVTRSTKTILSQFPDIGQVIKKIVEESDVGADCWRRTRVYTFFRQSKENEAIDIWQDTKGAKGPLWKKL